MELMLTIFNYAIVVIYGGGGMLLGLLVYLIKSGKVDVAPATKIEYEFIDMTNNYWLTWRGILLVIAVIYLVLS